MNKFPTIQNVSIIKLNDQRESKIWTWIKKKIIWNNNSLNRLKDNNLFLLILWSPFLLLILVIFAIFNHYGSIYFFIVFTDFYKFSFFSNITKLVTRVFGLWKKVIFQKWMWHRWVVQKKKLLRWYKISKVFF